MSCQPRDTIDRHATPSADRAVRTATLAKAHGMQSIAAPKGTSVGTQPRLATVGKAMGQPRLATVGKPTGQHKLSGVAPGGATTTAAASKLATTTTSKHKKRLSST